MNLLQAELSLFFLGSCDENGRKYTSWPDDIRTDPCYSFLDIKKYMRRRWEKQWQRKGRPNDSVIIPFSYGSVPSKERMRGLLLPLMMLMIIIVWLMDPLCCPLPVQSLDHFLVLYVLCFRNHSTPLFLSLRRDIIPWYHPFHDSRHRHKHLLLHTLGLSVLCQRIHLSRNSKVKRVDKWNSNGNIDPWNNLANCLSWTHNFRNRIQMQTFKHLWNSKNVTKKQFKLTVISLGLRLWILVISVVLLVMCLCRNRVLK